MKILVFPHEEATPYQASLYREMCPFPSRLSFGKTGRRKRLTAALIASPSPMLGALAADVRCGVRPLFGYHLAGDRRNYHRENDPDPQ